MGRKAVAYVSDVILGRTGEIISRKVQRRVLEQYARDNDIDVVAWFEDEKYDEEVFRRPGIQQLLAFEGEAEMLLVERSWCLSRNWEILRGFLAEMLGRSIRLECATMLWDCTSQIARHFCRSGGSTLACKLDGQAVPATRCREEGVQIRPPATQLFLHLARKHA